MKKLCLILLLISFSFFTYSQNVGIGNTTPTEKLHVDSGNIKVGTAVWGSSSDNRVVKFGDGSFVTVGEEDGDDVMSLKAKHFIFFPSSIPNGYSGNVGIGVSTPQEKLEVNGGVKVGYTSSTNNAGTIRYNGTDMEFNTGFNWRSMVNTFLDSSLSTLTPFSSTVRNTLVQIPDASMTITTPGTYLIIFKVNGYNNNSYFPSGGNYDTDGLAAFKINGSTIVYRDFVRLDVSGQSTSTRYDFVSNPTEYSCIRQINSTTNFSIWAQMSAIGSVSGTWTVNEAEIMAVRLF